MACTCDEGALDEREGEGRGGDFDEGTAGRGDGDVRKVLRKELGVVGELVVCDWLWQRVIPDGVCGEMRAAVDGEGDPDPGVERDHKGERHEHEHDVEFGFRDELDSCG